MIRVVRRRPIARLALGATLLVAGCTTPATGPGIVQPFRWGGDAEGGAPFVEADAADPSKVRGFDVEVAGMIARGLGRQPQFVQMTWASILQSVARGDVHAGINGLEDAPELRARFAVSMPYFEFREVLAVRIADSAKYRTLDDLAKHRVGTLGSTLAYRILLDAEKRMGVVPVSYDNDNHPYVDLIAGRVDGVLLDHIIAERSLKRTPGFVIQPGSAATGSYVVVFAPADTAMRDSADVILRERMRDGTLEKVYREWHVWDDSQRAHFDRMLASAPNSGTPGAGAQSSKINAYLPSLVRAAGITLALSCLAMALAVVVGVVVAAGRVYGPRVVQIPLAIYVEVIRGTPVLLQLFVLYYGLASVVKLPAFLAAMIGLGLNYAAYEAEIYRSALLAISKEQLEAARTLGLSEMQILKLVRGPQALRLALAPMTNDFVALLKDSSLVSVITVVELTKQTSIYAINIGSWFVPGLLCAAIYLVMSLPLSFLARSLAKRWHT